MFPSSFLNLLNQQDNLPEDPQVAFESRINSFVDDILKLVPLVALTHACSCILRASAQGQLRGSEETLGQVDNDNRDDDDGIIRRKDRKFNWLRHARDHASVFEDHMMKRGEAGEGKDESREE